MRVLIVSGIFHPEVGGPATYLRELADTLTRRGDHVGVVAYGDPRLPSDGEYPVWRVSRAGGRLRRLSRFIGVLWRRSRGQELWFVNDYGLPAALVARIRRPAIVMKIVGDFAWEYARRNHLVTDTIDEFQTRRYSWRVEALRKVQQFYVRRATRIIVPSAYLKKIVSGWGVPDSRIVVVYNAVNFTPPPRYPRQPGSGPVLLTAARLAPWKGMDHLLKILARLRREIPDARLLIAGDGPDRGALERLASDLELRSAIAWLGNISRERLIEEMLRADAFVLLSEYEGFSHVLLEAMRCGTPVVASAVGGNAELIRPGTDGLLVDPRQHDVVANELRALLVDDVSLRHYSEAARARSEEYRWGSLVEHTLEVFEEVAHKHSGNGE
jgi:glycosyltransferase involved in cell wall biosynthesis